MTGLAHEQFSAVVEYSAYIVPRCRVHFHTGGTRCLQLISLCYEYFALSTFNVLGTMISRSWATKSSMIFLGLSTMSTSRQ